MSGLSCCFLVLAAERLIGGTFWVDAVNPSSLHCNCAPIVASSGTAGTWQSEGVNRTPDTVHAAPGKRHDAV